MKNAVIRLALACVLSGGSAAFAATCTSQGTGFWDVAATWVCGAPGAADADGIPDANDQVIIANIAHTVTVRDNRQAGNLVFTGGNQAASLVIQNGVTLNITGGAGNGDLIINAPTAAVTKLVQLQASSTLTVARDLAINGGTAAGGRIARVEVAGGSTLTVGRDVTQANARSELVFSGTGAGTLNLARNMQDTGVFTCAACTLNLTGAGNHNLEQTYTYFNIVDLKTGGQGRFQAGAPTVNGSITNNGFLSMTTNTPTVTLGGGGVQMIGGTAATTFTSLTVAQGVGGSVTLGQNITVNTTLTLTTGIIDAGASTVILANTAAAALAGGSATSYVIGCLRKSFAAAGPLNWRGAGLDEFPVGIAGSYLPLEFTAGTTSTAGTLTVCAANGDHAQMTIANGGQIDTARSLNRHWTTDSTTLNTTAALASIIFKFPSGAANYDVGATPANFIVERYNGTIWFPTTLVAAGATSTQAQNIDLTGASSDFAVGEPLAGFTGNVGRFNAFETSTPANSLIGRIFTKLVGTNFSLDIVSINATRTAYGGAVAGVTVNLLDSSDNSGALSPATGCRASWTVVRCLAGGAGGCQQAALNIPAAGRVTLANMSHNQALKDARLQMVGGGNTACSSDRFSIRPTAFTVTSSANNNGTGAGTTVRAGANFSITATALAGYDGTPAVDNTAGMVIGTPTAGTIGGAFSAAPIGTGIATGASFTYTEVGNVGLAANAVFDLAFTAVDPTNDCTADFSNVLVGGRYGCRIGSVAVPQTTGVSGFGRFIPDHYFVAAGATLTNRSASACAPASTFTYMGEGIAIAFTLQARNSSDLVTQNYAGAYAKLNPATIAQLGFGAVDGTTNLTGRLDLSAGSAGSFTLGQAAVTATVGIMRGPVLPGPDTPDGPFTAVKIGVAPSDTESTPVTARTADMNMDVDGAGGNDHVQTGADTILRFGRLRVQNALGSERLPLEIPMETQYWQGSGFATNALDSCTSIPQSAIALTFNPMSALPAPNLAACETAFPGAVTFASGVAPVASVRLAAPGVGNEGPVRVTVNLGSAGGSYCPSVGGVFSAATSAGMSYLLGRWNDNAATGGDPDADANTNYDDKPSAIGSFGVYGTQPKNFIFFRENY
jgi:hypothetical protein